MALRKMSITQVDSATYAADTTIATDIETVGLLTRIDMTCEITPSATLTGANQPDGILRLIQNMRIVGSQHTYFNIPADDGSEGGVLLHYMNKEDGHGVGHIDAAVAAPVQATTQVNWVYHCGVRPRTMYGVDNPFDLTGFIPAGVEGQLKAEWTVAGNDVMDDSVTVSSAVMRFTLHRILGTDAEIRTEMAGQQVNYPPGANGMVPAWAAINHPNAGTTTDFDSEQIDIVVGAFLKRISVLCQDATATRTLRAGDEVTRLAIRVPKTSEDLLQFYADHLTCHMEYGTVLTVNSGAAESGGTEKMAVDFNAAPPNGIFLVDLRSRARSTGIGRDYGLDLRAEQNNTYKLGLYITTRAAGDDTLVIFERYQPYTGSLVQGR